VSPHSTLAAHSARDALPAGEVPESIGAGVVRIATPQQATGSVAGSGSMSTKGATLRMPASRFGGFN